MLQGSAFCRLGMAPDCPAEPPSSAEALRGKHLVQCCRPRASCITHCSTMPVQASATDPCCPSAHMWGPWDTHTEMLAAADTWQGQGVCAACTGGTCRELGPCQRGTSAPPAWSWPAPSYAGQWTTLTAPPLPSRRSSAAPAPSVAPEPDGTGLSHGLCGMHRSQQPLDGWAAASQGMREPTGEPSSSAPCWGIQAPGSWPGKPKQACRQKGHAAGAAAALHQRAGKADLACRDHGHWRHQHHAPSCRPVPACFARSLESQGPTGPFTSSVCCSLRHAPCRP